MGEKIMGEKIHNPRSGEAHDLAHPSKPSRSSEPDCRPTDGPDTLSRLLPLAGPRPPIPLERAARVEAAVHARWSERVRARRRRIVFAAAAVLATLALGVSAWWRTAAPRPSGGEPVAQIERLAGTVLRDDGSAGTRPVVAGEWLESGTILDSGELGRAALRLGSEASLRLDRSTRVRLIAPGRVELVTGALYVDSPGADEDVRVETRWGEVLEVGTQFEVRAVGEGIRLRVREGAVLLGSREGAHEVASGIELAIAPDGRPSRRAIAPHAREWDWVTSIAPSFEADGSTLGEFLGWVSRETGRQVRFADPDLAATAPELVLGGVVEELSPEQALFAVLPTCGLEHRLEDEAFVLVRSRS